MQRSTPGSEMDVSRDEDMDMSPPSAKKAGAGAVGYQGWAARRLILACHRIFVNSEEGGARDNCDGDLVSVSLEHRGVIYWCLSNINADVVPPSTSEADIRDEDVFHDGLTDFYHVWTLAEAFLLDVAPLPAAPLLRWLKMYSQSGEDETVRWELDEAERVALEADTQGRSAELTPAYWRALRSLVVGVVPRRAAGMLRCHPEGRDNAGEVGALARQLEKMPLLLPERPGGAEAQLDREGFFETWKRWQKGCKAAAATFGVVAGVGGDGLAGGGGGGGDSDERQGLRWLWGTLCGERSCLEEATESWAGLFAAVLAFERPDVRKEEVASVMRECARKHPPHEEEGFLLNVIRDASAGAVGSILRFAREHGDTLALSACAAHLVDLLSKAQLPSVTNAQRAWFFRRLADRLKAFPSGGWELAAAYVGAAGAGDVKLLEELARAVVPGSERAAHELVEWCRVNGLGEETTKSVCRTRGVAWIGKTGFSAAAMGTASEAGGCPDGGDGECTARVPGAWGKAAFWLAKGGGGVQLERLCAEVSERLMVAMFPDPGVPEDVEGQRAVLAEADGILAAVHPGVTGPELVFLERYTEIANNLLAETEARSSSMDDLPGPHARLAGILAVDLLAPRECSRAAVAARASTSSSSQSQVSSSPPRAWAHLLCIALPALREPIAGTAGAGGGGSAVGASSGRGFEDSINVCQVHALLAKLQVLVASEYRVGTEGGGRASTLPSAPSPYGFRGGKEQVLEIRCALATCLASTMMTQNAEETGGSGAMGGTWGSKRLPAEVLIAPRVAAGVYRCGV